jgi:hypothetical protein
MHTKFLRFEVAESLMIFNLEAISIVLILILRQGYSKTPDHHRGIEGQILCYTFSNLRYLYPSALGQVLRVNPLAMMSGTVRLPLSHKHARYLYCYLL